MIISIAKSSLGVGTLKHQSKIQKTAEEVFLVLNKLYQEFSLE